MQNNKRADGKVQATASPEIPDRGWVGGQKLPASL